jgi:hypothetical protein
VLLPTLLGLLGGLLTAIALAAAYPGVSVVLLALFAAYVWYMVTLMPIRGTIVSASRMGPIAAEKWLQAIPRLVLLVVLLQRATCR